LIKWDNKISGFIGAHCSTRGNTDSDGAVLVVRDFQKYSIPYQFPQIILLLLRYSHY